MFDTFSFSSIETAFSRRENAFCMLVCAPRLYSGHLWKISQKSHECQRRLGHGTKTSQRMYWENGSARPLTSELTVGRVHQKLLRGDKKSIRRTSLEALILPTTVSCIPRKHLLMKPYPQQLVQAMMADEKQKHKHGAMWRACHTSSWKPSGLEQRIPTKLKTVTQDMLPGVWEDLEYWLDVYHVSGGEHIEHLWNR